jgi:hypothetical protein
MKLADCRRTRKKFTVFIGDLFVADFVQIEGSGFADGQNA